MSKRAKKNPMTRDHIVPVELGGSNDPINIRMMPERKHIGRHRYFQNKLTHQEIAQVLDESAPVLTDDMIELSMIYREAIVRLLQKGLVYKNGVWR